jgi:hypothetical protein
MTHRFLSSSLLACAALLCAPRFQAADNGGSHWWKGNTHTHSVWSDGNDFPEMITDWYVKHGYQFLAISDHNVLQAKEVWMPEATILKRQITLGKSAMQKYLERFGDKWVETRQGDGGTEVRLKKLEEYRPLFEKPGQFLLVQAEEVSASFLVAPKKKAPIHLNGVNLQEEIAPIEGTSIGDVLRRNLRAIRDQGTRLGIPVLGHINHPNFQWALTAEDVANAVEENFFEIYNGHPRINYLGDETRAGYEKIWDIANTLRLTKLHARPLFGLGTDDAHHYHGGDSTPGRGWIMVHAPELRAESLIEAMRAGDFYASSGVSLDDVGFADGVLKIHIHPEKGASYTTRIVGTPINYDATTREIPSPEGDPNPVRLGYSDDVGKTFASIEGTEVSYHLTGKELYVRAVITSNLPHPNPSFEGQTQMAWTQPVGWKLGEPKK